MNILKSIFISVYLMLAMALSLYAGMRIAGGGDLFGWGGVLLTALPILLLIGWIMLTRSVARTSTRLPLLNGLGLAGIALSLWAVSSGRVDGLPAVLALIGWGGFIAYAYWYSTLDGRRANPKLRIGERLPAFTVRDVEGRDVASAQLTDRPAILLFFRGNWCPLCMAQIKELAARYQELAALGVRVALIAPQPHENTRALAKKFGVAFDFLTDKGAEAARRLGIAHAQGLPLGMQMLGYDSDTVLPTVIITDRGGRIVWTHETDNYRVRPEPELYLEILREKGILAA